MNQHEEILTGGNVNHIVRKADTVRRPTGDWSPNVHALLRHLEKQNFGERHVFSESMTPGVKY